MKSSFSYYNSHNYDEAYEIIASYPDPDGDLLAAKQKIAYFRGLSALEKGDTEGDGNITIVAMYTKYRGIPNEQDEEGNDEKDWFGYSLHA